jgi:hypothetical protein
MLLKSGVLYICIYRLIFSIDSNWLVSSAITLPRWLISRGLLISILKLISVFHIRKVADRIAALITNISRISLLKWRSLTRRSRSLIHRLHELPNRRAIVAVSTCFKSINRSRLHLIENKRTLSLFNRETINKHHINR